MILNNEDMGLEKDIKKFRNNPQLSVDTIFDLLFDDTETSINGCKRMKKGKYRVVNIREPFMTNMKHLVYVIKSNRSNASYEWAISTEAIDFAIQKKYIVINN